MSTSLLQGKGKNKEELDAMQVAEDAREQNWHLPSFVGDLFMGSLHLDEILPYPEQTAADKKIGDEYLARVDAFLRAKVDGDEIDRTGEIPETVMSGLRELGAFGMKIPKEYGGLGLSQVNYNRALAMICGACASTGAMLSAHQSIGVPQPLMLFGTPDQKKKYLPKLAQGAVSAFALTEPEVGSDPAQMSTTATPSDDGASYVINGTKLWCTNGAIADILVVMARTPSLHVDGREKKQITAFIVEKGMPGFEVLHRCQFMGLKGIQNALLKFTNVKVPKENIIWGSGKGLRLALITLNAGRLSLPAGCIGGTREGLRVAREWGNERKQWGAAIGYHEAGSHKIAGIASRLFAMEAITWMSGTWVDRKSHDIRLEAAMAKVFCSEHSWKIADDVVQLRGGRGYETANSLRARGEKAAPVERTMRDARINMIVEGTSDILRLFIAREALDRHLAVAGDVLNSRLPIGRRLAAVVKAGLFYVRWYPARVLGAFFSGFFVPGGPLAGHLRFASRTSHRLALATFHKMLRHGPGLEKRQLTLCRLVDIATDLFVMAATVARARARLDEDEKRFTHTEAVADLFCRQARLRVRENFRALHCNLDAQERRVAKAVLTGGTKWMETHDFAPLESPMPGLTPGRGTAESARSVPRSNPL